MRRWIVWPLLWTLLLGGVASAEDFDLQSWLQRPGVRAVAVEFYATWCQPCMEAMPRWKALKDRFGKDGLRIIVVKTQDPSVRPLGWSPDAYVDDPDGVIAKQFGVGDQLPSAYLWGWDGQLLVRRGHITEIESGVEQILNATPRVTIVPGDGVDAAIVESLKERLFDTGKVLVVADAADRERLGAERLQQASNIQVDEARKCELGKEVPPNSLLKVSIVGQLLTLGLIDIESGCQKQTAQVPWDVTSPQEVRRRSFDAVEALLAKLRGPFEWPGKPLPKKAAVATAPVAAPARLGSASTEFELEDTEEVVAEFASEPTGAVVLLDGKVLCRSTPCSKQVAVGPHTVTMSLDEYEDAAQDVTIDRKSRRTMLRLNPTFALLSVETVPPRLALNVDARDAGVSPMPEKRVPPGAHDILLADRCFAATGERVVVAKGERRTVRLEAAARLAGIKVSAQDAQGNDLEGEVEVDGTALGSTPVTKKVPLCSRAVRVRLPDGRVWTAALDLKEAQVFPLVAIFEGDAPSTPMALQETESAPVEAKKADPPPFRHWALRGGVGPSVGVVGLGLEYRMDDTTSFWIGGGRYPVSFGMTTYAEEDGGPFFDWWIVQSDPGWTEVPLPSGTISGGTFGYDIRLWDRLSFKLGAGGGYRSVEGKEDGWGWIIEANGGVLW